MLDNLLNLIGFCDLRNHFSQNFSTLQKKKFLSKQKKPKHSAVHSDTYFSQKGNQCMSLPSEVFDFLTTLGIVAVICAVPLFLPTLVRAVSSAARFGINLFR